jgi:hypothetical protein
MYQYLPASHQEANGLSRTVAFWVRLDLNVTAFEQQDWLNCAFFPAFFCRSV